MNRPNSELIFALIIGINKYKAENQFGRLKGAVNDAKAFKDFLTGLHVPGPQIKFLENEQATRHFILSTFTSHFLENSEIPDGGQAAMIFFFAGHGSRVESTGNLLASDSKVEVLCPFDERTTDTNGDYVEGIPDYFLAQQLHQLAQKKGSNITVILDSCHSGGMARDDFDVAVRSPEERSRLPAPALSDQGGYTDTTTQSYDLWTPSAASHILLAACGQDGKAYESSSEPFHGHFTERLIPELRKNLLKGTTYVEMIDNLPPFPVKTQIPHCGGAYTGRLMFTMNHPVPGTRTLPVKKIHMVWGASSEGVHEGKSFSVKARDGTTVCSLVVRMVAESRVLLATPDCMPFNIPKGSKTEPKGISGLREQSSSQAFLIRTGSFDGVRMGMDFPVRAPDGTMIEGLTAQIVGINQTVLVWKGNQPDHILPDGAHVVVKDWKDKVHVYVPPDFVPKLFPLDPADVGRYDEAQSYGLADIALRKVEDDIVLERMKGMSLERARERRFPLETEVGPLHLPSAIGGIAHFHYFLEHRNQSTLLSGFSLEMYRLEGDPPKRRPIGENIVQPDGENLYKAEIISDAKASYGFKICNHTNQDLFPYLFYFNTVKYTISPWYIPETVHGRPPLHQISGGVAGEVPIGMGGESAFSFMLPEGESSSSGFIKLFVSTQHLDLAWIEQAISPFKAEFVGMGRIDVYRENFNRPDWAGLLVRLTMNNQHMDRSTQNSVEFVHPRSRGFVYLRYLLGTFLFLGGVCFYYVY
ncbi:caspase domain-containing protein [Mycena epipterygia]|nr:caspase domain-containing protein [Mycena epipterygia]